METKPVIQRGDKQNMTWYFISYRWMRLGTSYKPYWAYDDKVSQKHPIKWLMETRKYHGEDEKYRYDYYIVFWSEIPEELAIEYKENE